jgi:hypothetical protein
MGRTQSFCLSQPRFRVIWVFRLPIGMPKSKSVSMRKGGRSVYIPGWSEIETIPCSPYRAASSFEYITFACEPRTQP